MSEIILPGRSGRKASVFITPFSAESLVKINIGGTASAAWTTTNLAMFHPISLPEQVTVNRFFWCNGTTASTNNLQVGVYDSAGNAIKLGTSSTLASGASQPQFDNVADFMLYPDKLYYMALWCSGTTTHVVRANPAGAGRYGREAGIYQVASLSGGLTSTVTFAAASTVATCPLYGLALRASP